MVSEDITELREGRLGHFKPLLRQAARWAQDNSGALMTAEPEIPKSLYGRSADNWRPLLAIADRAGGEWPECARRVAQTLSGRCIGQTASVMLLDDIKSIFGEPTDDQISSASMIDSLTSMEDRPWPEWKSGKPMTARQLAKMLEPFGIGPKQLWIGGRKQRGYERAQFEEAFGRYLGDLSGSPVEPLETASFSDFDPGRTFQPLPDRNGKKPSKPDGSTVLPDEKPLKHAFDGDGDPFASLKDPSLKLKPRVDEYPELPSFLDRRTTQTRTHSDDDVERVSY